MGESTDPLCAAAKRLRLIETWLAAAGLTTRMHVSPNAMDLTATLRQPGHREIEVVIDEDGYTELRYWASLSDTPAQAVAIITSALAAISAVQGSVARIAPARQTHAGVAGYDGAITERAGASGMPGPQDRVAEQEHNPDLARPREPDHPREGPAQSADLQTRLERLPVGHPSSPYRDDGSRKPSTPDLADYELPLPDELPPDTDQPDSRLPTENKARVGPDGSWDWKGHHLTPDQSRAGDVALAKCRDAEGRDADGSYREHGLTPAMRRIEAQLDHGHLVQDTEKFALKDPDSFKEKLAETIVSNPDKSPEELASEIHDGVRYTFVFSVEQYSEGLWDVHSKAEERGCELEVRRNSWTKEEYKGVNTRWLDPTSGQRFEVQFHTETSWDTKQQTHYAYKLISDPRTSPSEVQRLREYQKVVSSRVEIPPGAVGIPDYRKEGR
jgi:hypothetical protein